MLDFRRRLSGPMAIVASIAITLTSACASRIASQPAQPTQRTAVAAAAPPSAPVAPAAVAAVQPVPAAKQVPPAGNITTAPTDIRRFSPKETGLTAGVPADQLDLRKVFEELGPETTQWYQHVQALSDPFFEGRAPGTHGGQVAAEYIEFYMKKYGLEPAFASNVNESSADNAESDGYRQLFDFASPNPKIRVVEAAASINDQALQDGTDFVLLGNSGNGAVTAQVTFVGYGIAEGKDGYTSFEETTNLNERIALLMRYEPLDEQGKSRWSQARFSQYSAIAAKIKNVSDRGAAAILLVNPPGAVDGKTGLESLASSRRFGNRQNIPVVQITPEAANLLLAQGDPQKRDLLAWRKMADAGEVKSVNLDPSLMVSVTASLDVDDRLKFQNVAGVLRGKGNLADQWIVIGAHYDHVGYGYTGATPKNVGQLHPGADDNASGTAGVLVAAKRLIKQYQDAGDNANLRSIMFIAFGAEEAGLIGSKHFVENPPISLGAIDLMINMDMIGRLRSNTLLVQGTGTAERFDEILKPMFEQSGLKIAESATGRGPSDHSSFYDKKIPVLFLFTGEHAEYHQPSDRGFTVNPAGAIKIVDLLQALAMHFAAMPERLVYAQAGSSGPGRDTGAKVSLGTMPDYTAELETGMRVDSVRDGSSAADAGIQAGDILLTWNGQEIEGPRKLAELLGKHEPGDKVKIVLRRDQEEKTVEVVLKGRAAQ